MVEVSRGDGIERGKGVSDRDASRSDEGRNTYSFENDDDEGAYLARSGRHERDVQGVRRQPCSFCKGVDGG